MTLGSLFDGSGGFPLAGAMHGIKPVWASEIEPYPIRVTKARFPNMEHLGSVLDVKGDQVIIGISVPKSIPIYRKEVYLVLSATTKYNNSSLL